MSLLRTHCVSVSEAIKTETRNRSSQFCRRLKVQIQQQLQTLSLAALLLCAQKKSPIP
ncbi:uncharacterized protein EKO05_0005182 [Ascochyta rabiei]|uniref:uncharacterized protein n=1 Tax=Didymella rabiei TaxID=5454 RepID=UPI00220763CE|nr:uncharacterized protein EKO05_0005182 [Ascochyta rabiei]UPX14707.1 hypothetical protein EKO05_0005182 [Ascochyta rabiei]